MQEDGGVADGFGVALRVARDGAQLLLQQRRIAYETGKHRDSSVFLIVRGTACSPKSWRCSIPSLVASQQVLSQSASPMLKAL